MYMNYTLSNHILVFLNYMRLFPCLFPSPMPMGGGGVVPLVLHSVYSHSSSRRLVGKGHSSLHYMVIIPDSCLRVTGLTLHLVNKLRVEGGTLFIGDGRDHSPLH